MQILFLSLLLVMVRADEVLQNCGSHSVVHNAELVNIEAIDNCVMCKKNTTASVKIDFTPNKVSTKLTATVYAVLGTTKMKVPVRGGDLCNKADSQLKCPLEVGVKSTYMINYKVPPTSPIQSAPIIWELKDEEGEVIICTQFLACMI